MLAPQQPLTNTLPTFAEAIARLERDESLTTETRRHWTCALNRIAHALDRPLKVIPAVWSAIRADVERLHPKPLGWQPKTLANHKTNLKAALNHLGRVGTSSPENLPLSEAWAALWKQPVSSSLRRRLSNFVRFCSARSILPEAVSEAVLDVYFQYRADATVLRFGRAERRRVARAWNEAAEAIPGWPQQLIGIEPDARFSGPPWEAFPASLREEVETYLNDLAKARRAADGKRIKPAKVSTIRTRRAELLAFARKAVALGHPIEALTSLHTLLRPKLAAQVIYAYWDNNGENPATYTIDLAVRLHAMARQTGCLDESELVELDDMRAALEDHRSNDMTEKNRAVVRRIYTSEIWDDVIALPAQLLREARRLRPHRPFEAALKAQMAVAVGVLCFAPIRIGNLARTRLEENLVRPGGPDGPYWLVFPNYDVKNRVALEFAFDSLLSALIREYVHDYQPALLRGSNEPWLFPGKSGGHKVCHLLSGQITDTVQKHTGLRLTAHQFRHVAAAFILKRKPGEYEFVRRILGHKRLETTSRAYIGLETLQSSQQFSQMLRMPARRADHFAGRAIR